MKMVFGFDKGLFMWLNFIEHDKETFESHKKSSSEGLKIMKWINSYK